MKSETTARYRELFSAAPRAVQLKIGAAYRLWAQNPRHPSLRFKKIHDTLPVFSTRVDLDWRAVGVLKDDTDLVLGGFAR